MVHAIDTTNKFCVGIGAVSLTLARGLNDIVIALPVPQRLSEDDALLLAAYIVATVADSDKWEAALSAVESA